MKLTAATRLWLAWQVLRGRIVEARWDARDDLVSITFVGITERVGL